jgi:hypothetical protein
VIDELDVFGNARTTVVQLKDHDRLNDLHALDQIRRACTAYAPVHAAAIITTAAEEDASFAAARQLLGTELQIPVSVVLGEQLARWLLGSLEAIATAAGC